MTGVEPADGMTQIAEREGMQIIKVFENQKIIKLPIVRSRKFGSFLGCSGYPECRYAKNFDHGMKIDRTKGLI
ncbi:MAG: topoisomerase DNA-binding C4 zinc finger domain-containing protein [Parasporobacterium sp.]|nr:topoisomerase DNA-binding C4 zinc finger domain-containing protein [Parasporobacterium sp.]